MVYIRLFLAASILLFSSCNSNKSKSNKAIELNEPLQVYLINVLKAMDEIPDERKEKLMQLANYIDSTSKNNDTIKLTFICTHNSRRSHFAQIWAQTAAYYYGIDKVICYSGGTEATACNIRTIEALKRAGFLINTTDTSINPQYKVQFITNMEPITAFSKKYSDAPNPTENFAAIMTCSHADEACPIVYGASFRIAIPYNDPKESDNTPGEKAVYDERCMQIASEMFFVFSSIK